VPGSLILWLVIFSAAILAIYMGGRSQAERAEKVALSELYKQLDDGVVRSVTLKGNEVRWQSVDKGGTPVPGIPESAHSFTALTSPEHVRDLINQISARNSEMETKERKAAQGGLRVPAGNRIRLSVEQPSELLWGAIIQLLPWAVFIALAWFFIFRPLRSPTGSGGVLSFGKSRAKFISKERTGITFDDVAGIDEAKEEVQEIVEFLKNPARFQRLGGRIPRGVMLIGQPGTGKTLLAKAIAGEAAVPFLSICGSDFVEMFVGVGASRVRDLFRQAKENSPCIIFLDEIDAVGRRRGSGLGGGHDEREQTLNAILVEMDGFERDEGIIVIAATNRPDVLDPALLRPGRFDREIFVDLPDVKGREEILKVHARRVKMSPTVDLRILARGTASFSGADLEAIINEAAILATMRNHAAVEMPDLEEARDKIRWGRQKRSKVMDEEDKRITAIHESGHTLLGKLLPEVEPMHKVSIIPQGRALGATMYLPEKDRYHMQRKRLLGTICVALAGRISEGMFCNDISSGAQSDFEQATEIARLMVCKWGMSEKLGPINYTDDEEHLFLGREITRTRTHSEATALTIDSEIRAIIDSCYQRTQDLLREHADKVKRISEALLKYETLYSEDVDKVIAGLPVDEIRLASRAPMPTPEAAPPKAVAPRPAQGIGGPEFAKA
jgi:cell division protease FtsH